MFQEAGAKSSRWLGRLMALAVLVVGRWFWFGFHQLMRRRARRF